MGNGRASPTCQQLRYIYKFIYTLINNNDNSALGLWDWYLAKNSIFLKINAFGWQCLAVWFQWMFPLFHWIIPRSHLMPWSHLCVKPPRMSHVAILGFWGDTWLTRGKYGIYMAVRGSHGALTGSTWRLLETGEKFQNMFKILPRKISHFYRRVSDVAVTRIPSLVLRNTW